MKDNILSGLTVGIIALPLSMALAIATGVPPELGLYTAIIAGIFAAVFGSSKINISGPTAAFIVILIPIVQEFGITGLLLCGLLSGIILVLIGVLKLGTLIELIPYPVTVGFTSGIAVVIATFQIKDFFGLTIPNFEGSYLDKIYLIFNSFHTFNIYEFFIGALTLSLLIFWQKTKSKIPSALIALTITTIVVAFLNIYFNIDISTINSTFNYKIGSLEGTGIPPIPLQFSLPWSFLAPEDINFTLIYKLLPHAIAIAILGALESLLCAVISDGMTGNKTDPNKELIGQGITNMIVPFFGGIPATAAIARTVVNIKSGGTSKLSSIVHSLFILVSITFLAKYLSYLPMASLSALLLMVAWNMSEVKHFVNIIKIAQKDDVYVLLTCFFLTVIIDMQIAVAVGIGLASVLFIKRTIDLYSIELVSNQSREYQDNLENILIYDINGPMFFGAAQKALKTLLNINEKTNIVILNMKNVSMLDVTAMVALKSIVNSFETEQKKLIFCGLNQNIQNKLQRAKFDYVTTFSNLEDAIKYSKQLGKIKP
ncbi:C4-dicarboxylic acid transporter DauA [Aliarcobacter butzleri]|uniref:C4-dicarboxylic acid transporter DauA n=1 Tax=bioreactor metagenome TaxID=1076179 RepID=A0A644UIM2_9ZZZZ|nr:C4-dicarboxylic acid transporter DauA [Aliarcobacter butzleri]MCG3681473.1 C4-dicarboxylic acid transporter DauA [Aliarcobacter butzleri]MCG3705882.1 C4-dicarboxylic acid transporter DauA [Aliarcobacter butzleri]MCT7568680.1 C4-dicarboxylic acid transporter DauA [Aliarcobacter butzleri]MCT7612110.1 C4-dicarboxylic acid transporter DauA [Aliarcobacter butzleri]MCT7621096.1 C4-dicarboxylic acid transporter DauA [Aliarcobacter butzleri]